MVYMHRKSTWFDELKWLRRLNIRCCPKVIEIQGLEGLESLGSFVIDGCKSMETLPDLSKLKILKTLDISNCEKLFEIRKLEKLLSLEYLNIGDCKEVSSLGTHLFMNRIVLLRVGRPNWQRRVKYMLVISEFSLKEKSGAGKSYLNPDEYSSENFFYLILRIQMLMKLHINALYNFHGLPETQFQLLDAQKWVRSRAIDQKLKEAEIKLWSRLHGSEEIRLPHGVDSMNSRESATSDWVLGPILGFWDRSQKHSFAKVLI
ncbi:hypothetical protein LguiB_013438 [Lonicera macranthoides]